MQGLNPFSYHFVGSGSGNPLHRFLLQRNWGACDTISQVNLLTPHPHFSVDRGGFKSPRTDLSYEILFGGAKAGVSPRKKL